MTDAATAAEPAPLAIAVVVGVRGSLVLQAMRAWANSTPWTRKLITEVAAVPTLAALAPFVPRGRDTIVVCPGYAPAVAARELPPASWRCLVAVPPFGEPAPPGPWLGAPAGPPIVVSSDPVATVKKEFVRVLNAGAVVRELVARDDLVKFFALRYDIWSAEGYIRPERNASVARLELDYTDRTSLPIGAFAPDGTLIGCARLVREVGAERPQQRAVIDTIVDGSEDRILALNYAYPPTFVHPFDVLEAFPAFRPYYKRMVRSRRSKAEVSRVIVRPEWRGTRLAEILVDRLVEIAARERIEHLFLACRESIAHVYRASGFQRVPDLASVRFGDIPVPSILMERQV